MSNQHRVTLAQVARVVLLKQATPAQQALRKMVSGRI